MSGDANGNPSGDAGGNANAPFVAQLRSRPGAIRIAQPGQATISVRVQMPEVWDTVRIEVAPSEPVLTVKLRALEALYPEAEHHEDFVMKLNGFEVLDEHESVVESGALDGSTYLVGYRRRQPIRR